MPVATTLLLGAGSNCRYGFPSGNDLRAELLALTEESEQVLGHTRTAIRSFVHSFGRSQEYSIDAFLGRRPEFVPVGKTAIARAIISAESRTDVFAEKREDHWYRYLLNLIASCHWQDFDPSWLSIVTFNYDRSLEFYLGEALRERFGKSHAEVSARLAPLRIVHVYGSLGSPWRGDADYLPYKTRSDEDQTYAEEHWIREGAARLRVIPEGRDDDPSLADARELLSRAERIGVLGFGFDETNLRRIGAPHVFRNAGKAKFARATCIGLNQAEVEITNKRMFDDGRPERFRPVQCLELLRECQILT